MRRRFPFSFFFYLFLICPPTHLRAETSVSYTRISGSQSYDGHNLELSLGSESGTKLGGGFNRYSSDVSSGSVSTYSLSLGGGTPDESWQIFGSLTPEVDGYKAKSVGLNVSTISLPDEEEESGSSAAQTYAHLGYHRIMHTDGSPSIDVNQNDLSSGLTYRIAKTALFGSFTKSLYDKNPPSSLRSAKYSHISGVSQQIQDYSDYSIAGKIEQGLLSWLKIMGSYTRAQYKTGGAGSANSYTTGIGVSWQSLKGTIEFNQFIPSNGSSPKYVSAGLGFGF